MKPIHILLILIVLLGVAAGIYAFGVMNAPEDENAVLVREETLTCSNGTGFVVQYLTNENVIVNLGGVPYELSPAVSASGARYENADETFVFWNQGDESMILVDGEVVYEECRSADAAAEEPNGENESPEEEQPPTESDVSDLIRLDSPVANGVIESPLVIEGEARGQWYFEATFPIVLTNWDGLIIAEGFATAEGEWMTEEFVPFSAELEFENPWSEGDPDFMKRGFLILQKSNPSGLPENDAALEIQVQFAE